MRVWHSADWADGFGAVAFVNAAQTELVEIYVNINKFGTTLDRHSLKASVGGGRRVVSFTVYYTDAKHDMAIVDDDDGLMGAFSIITIVSALA